PSSRCPTTVQSRLRLLYRHSLSLFFFFNDTATPEFSTLSLHDALPICRIGDHADGDGFYEPLKAAAGAWLRVHGSAVDTARRQRSEEHTSELQSLTNLVCRLLLEKKKKKATTM